jgi:hypothetical protein
MCITLFIRFDLPDIHPPLFGGMAVAALRIVPPVGIGVAGGAAVVLKEKTLRFFTGRGQGGAVAPVALLYFFMGAGEHITGFGVIEFLYVPLNQRRIFPLVLLVTVAAAFVFVPVVACACLYPRGQFPMASQAS